jgi:20S proteasome alpha/beta subunit
MVTPSLESFANSVEDASAPGDANDFSQSLLDTRTDLIDLSPAANLAREFSGAAATDATVANNGSSNSLADVVSFAGSGIVFSNSYTANVTQQFKNNILAAEQDIASHWSNSITLNLKFDAQALGTNGTFLASNSWPSFVNVSYASLKAALTSHDGSNPDAQAAVASLPAADPNPRGGLDWSLPEAYARMLGLSQSAPATDDTVTLNTSYNWSYGQDVVGTIEHEITEGAMGRVGGLGDQNGVWSTMDLFRYSASGVRDFTDGRDGKATFFSVNGSQLLSQFNNQFNGATHVNLGDTADFSVLDVFGFGSPGTGLTLSSTDLHVMDVLGWTPGASPPPPDTTPPSLVHESSLSILAAGTTLTFFSSILQFDDNVSSHGQETYTIISPPSHGDLRKNGVTTSSFTQADIDNGLITYQANTAGLDAFTFRVTDAAGNSTGDQQFKFQITSPLDTTPPSLVRNLGLAVNAGAVGVITSAALRFDDNVSPHSQETYTIDAAPPRGTLLKNGSATSSFTQSDVDNGLITYRAGNTASLDAFGYRVADAAGNATNEFQFALQTTAVIESFGSTSLVQVGNNYFLYPVGGASGPGLSFSGAPFVVGQFGGWTAIGAEKTASGYEVAWKNGAADQYTVWNLDANGNYIGNATGVVSGADYALQSLETSFQQDLNLDGVTGARTTTIEAFGATRLDQVANEFFLHDGVGNGPSVKFQGTVYMPGQFGGWTPIGAEKTASGYEVAWKNGAADQYTVWNLDANGNYTSSATGVVSGADYTLQSLETSFQQDLNLDGLTGPGTTTIEAFGATRLDQMANEFFLHDGVGNGPSVKFQGAVYMAGQFGGWTPIGAEKTASGYEVAWKNGAADQYTVWNLDANGNYIGNAIGVVSGNSTALESLEPSFQQDLNNDGLIGAPPASHANLNAGTSLNIAQLVSYMASTFAFPSSGSSASNPVYVSETQPPFLAPVHI